MEYEIAHENIRNEKSNRVLKGMEKIPELFWQAKIPCEINKPLCEIKLMWSSAKKFIQVKQNSLWIWDLKVPSKPRHPGCQGTGLSPSLVLRSQYIFLIYFYYLLRCIIWRRKRGHHQTKVLAWATSEEYIISILSPNHGNKTKAELSFE